MVPCSTTTVPGRPRWSCTGPKTPPGSMVTLRVRSWYPSKPSTSGPRSTVAHSSTVTPVVSGVPSCSLTRSILPIADREYGGARPDDAKDPEASFPPSEPIRPPAGAPNVLVILLDDVG